jgi:ornithine cyclodeaminase/alanine dehydrogenase-like protein (mu-crystallin family)
MSNGREGGSTFRVIGRADIERLLPIDVCIQLMDSTFRALGAGEIVLPLRTVLRPTGGNALYVMPAFTRAPASLATKLVSWFPANRARGKETHQGVVVLFDTEDGSPAALLDAAALTALRTAAVSAVATRALAREGATQLAILGSGVQARSHLAAMRAVRPIERVRVWSPTPEHLRAFVEESGAAGTAIEAASSAQAAVEGADIICAVTSSPIPVVHGEWLRGGEHINAIGASTPMTRELDSEAVRRSRFFVDTRDTAINESGDYLIPLREGVIAQDHIAGELGHVLLGNVKARQSAEDITVFKSLGLAAQDAVAGQHILRRAAQRDAGQAVAFP